MKYPQLVSTRTVNEISDWLIKRLEDLDIEQPGVYSRFLLSLLHTPYKVNAIDLLELPQLKDLKQPYHLLNKNNEELKRLAAVESLMEVSAESNKMNIISLVDELHLKLRKIENSGEDSGSAAMNGRTNVASSPTSSNSRIQKNLKKIKRTHGTENPTKNYYLAFPALSGGKKSTATTTITSEESKASSPGEVIVAETKKDSANHLQLLCWSSLMSKDNSQKLTPAAETSSGGVGGASGLKRPKRKRRYGRCKTTANDRKHDVQCNAKSFDVYDGAAFSPKVKSGSSSSNSKKHQRNQYVTIKNPKGCVVARKSDFSSAEIHPPSGAPWDMDFKGNWEMERDLISEFFQQQKHQSEETAPQSIEKSASQADFAMEEEAVDDDDMIMMKFLPTKLMDDENDGGIEMKKEAQSIRSLKSKFDENVKALWNDVEEPSSGNASLVSSFTSEKNSLGLFNFNGHQPHHQHHHMYRSMGADDFLSQFDSSLNGVGHQVAYPQPTPTSSSLASPGSAEKFIKSGTNLTSSIWSDSDFMHEPESLICKDVVDHCDDAIFKRMKSIGAEMRDWQRSICDEVEVSLANHSERGAFQRFRTQMTSTIIRASYHPVTGNHVHANLDTSADDSDDDEENSNLLTSKKSHFTPVMVDGHSFHIESNWDEIEYKQTADGQLMYNDKIYKLWTGRCERLNYRYDNSPIDLESIERDGQNPNFCLDSGDFQIHYVYRDENDKACQTETADFLRASTRSLLEISEQYCKRKIYDEYLNNKWRYNLQSEDSNDYSFFSVNRTKNLNPNPTQTMTSCPSSSSSVSTITSDPFESWRSLNANDDDPTGPQCTHRLWEQCATCMKKTDKNQPKPFPANRLLKDELRMDGDEIMNVIQNLYITGDFCDDEEKDEGDCAMDLNHFYMDMLDDSNDSRFYEAAEQKIQQEKADQEKKKLTPNMFEEGLDEITLAKFQWQMEEKRKKETKGQEEYLKLWNWIQTVSEGEQHLPDSNNNNQMSVIQRPQNRKRRHSTCQNFMEKKTDFCFQSFLTQSPTVLIEDNANIFVDASKMIKVNIENLLLIAENHAAAWHDPKDNGSTNYYRNILQQQHALIKQLDLARPLTR